MDKKQAQQMNAEMSSALFSERERFEMLFAEHWKKIAVIGIAVALVVALAFASWSFVKQKAIKATYEFADAVDAPALEKVLAANGSKIGAVAARQRLVQIYIDSKKYDDAVKHLKLIISDPNADDAVRGRATLDQALVLELNGKIKDAAAVFAKVASDVNYKTALRLEAAAAAGRLMASYDAKGAAAVLDRGSKLAPDSQLAAYHLGTVKSLQLALVNGELSVKPAAKAVKPAAKAVKPAAKAAKPGKKK